MEREEQGSDFRDEFWWVFRLSDGEFLGEQRVGLGAGDHNVNQFPKGVRPIVATPLVVVHWFRLHPRPYPYVIDARFELVDQSGRTVGQVDLPGDYADGDQHCVLGEIRFEDLVRSQEPRRFEVYSFRERAWLTYEVSEDPEQAGSWQLEEIRRVPEEHPPLPPSSWRE